MAITDVLPNGPYIGPPPIPKKNTVLTADQIAAEMLAFIMQKARESLPKDTSEHEVKRRAAKFAQALAGMG